MDQIIQLQDNLRQVRQDINSMLNQINQQIMGTEQIVQNIGNQLSQQHQFQGQMATQGSNYRTDQQNQYGLNQIQSYSGNQQLNNRRSNQWENINPISGLNVHKPTSVQQSGVNKYGATYSSGNDYGQ